MWFIIFLFSICVIFFITSTFAIFFANLNLIPCSERRYFFLLISYAFFFPRYFILFISKGKNFGILSKLYLFRSWLVRSCLMNRLCFDYFLFVLFRCFKVWVLTFKGIIFKVNMLLLSEPLPWLLLLLLSVAMLQVLNAMHPRI